MYDRLCMKLTLTEKYTEKSEVRDAVSRFRSILTSRLRHRCDHDPK